jgi:hypothetical protein
MIMSDRPTCAGGCGRNAEKKGKKRDGSPRFSKFCSKCLDKENAKIWANSKF